MKNWKLSMLFTSKEDESHFKGHIFKDHNPTTGLPQVMLGPPILEILETRNANYVKEIKCKRSAGK
jgi:hypothetical protein